MLYGLARPGLDHEVAEANPGRKLYYYEWQEEGGHVWQVPADQLRRGADAPVTPGKYP
ncbi:hypothetical protein D3C83_253520 [compost metagenome]